MRIVYWASSMSLFILALMALKNGDIGTASVATIVAVSHACLSALKR